MLSITYDCDWSGPLLPREFQRMFVMVPNCKEDFDIYFMRCPESATPQTIVYEVPFQRSRIILALPRGRWDPVIAAHEFKHLLQVISGEHNSRTPKELEDEANAFETTWGNHWSEPAPEVGSHSRD